MARRRFSFVDGFAHGIGHVVGVHDDMAFTVSGGSSDGLDEGGFGTEEAFFICIEDRYQSDFRNVEAFSEKVNAYQYIENIETHIPDDLGRVPKCRCQNGGSGRGFLRLSYILSGLLPFV